MSPHQDLLAEVVDLAQAAGLLDADGDLDTSWFDAPLTRTAQVFGDDGQRGALLDLLDGVLGQDPGARPRPGERWYALLPGGGIGNLYLTVDDSAAGLTRVGVAGALHGPRGAGVGDVTADFVLRVPVLDATPSSMTMVLGQQGAPVEAALGVVLHAADIDSLELTASLDACGRRHRGHRRPERAVRTTDRCPRPGRSWRPGYRRGSCSCCRPGSPTPESRRRSRACPNCWASARATRCRSPAARRPSGPGSPASARAGPRHRSPRRCSTSSTTSSA